ncbi:MAG TPA: nitroreductase family deazaflavin-dependent oxidoreductase [Pseudonocardia sp.]|jgi:deazaflavin-dependent oxidoreductase (nitroreductase family)|nr:nitroreductase family deazaflavin-dependent oxidoreductase [Pseudonocardia sp.]
MSTGGGEPPRWLRAVFRAPNWLYRHELGWLLGRRFLCLAHRGRGSNRQYVTVLEVLAHDTASRRFTVLSAFGPGADWLRNLDAGGPAEIVVGRERFAADYRRLEPDEATSVLDDYERRNRWIAPVLRSALSWVSGWRYDSSLAARRRLVEQLPVIVFFPRE